MALALAGADSLLQPFADTFLGLMGLPQINFDPNQFFQSVLVDLVPEVTVLRWGPWVINQTPVPVLTVAGANWFTHYSTLWKNLVMPGLDDGVLTIESQAASALPLFPFPSGYIPDSEPPYYPQIFDLGLGVPDDTGQVGVSLPIPTVNGLLRGTGFYLDQWWDPQLFSWHPLLPSTYVAGACVPEISVTGMLQPVDKHDLFHSLLPYANHHWFLQTASSHSGPFSFDGTGGLFSDPIFGDPPANEEVCVVTDPNAYVPYLYSDQHYVQLLRPEVADLMEETVKGWRVTFTIPWIDETVTWWIWKRTYHRTAGWDTMTECDYVYQYAVP